MVERVGLSGKGGGVERGVMGLASGGDVHDFMRCIGLIWTMEFILLDRYSMTAVVLVDSSIPSGCLDFIVVLELGSIEEQE